MIETMLLPKEVARAWRLSVYTIRRYLRDGDLAGRKVGGLWRIHPRDALALGEALGAPKAPVDPSAPWAKDSLFQGLPPRAATVLIEVLEVGSLQQLADLDMERVQQVKNCGEVTYRSIAEAKIWAQALVEETK